MMGSCDGLMPQPSMPLHKIALVEYNVPGHEGGVGGTDKGRNGHRVDTVPIANGVIKAGSLCVPVKYVPEAHDAFATIVRQFDGVIVRVFGGMHG